MEEDEEGNEEEGESGEEDEPGAEEESDDEGDEEEEQEEGSSEEEDCHSDLDSEQESESEERNQDDEETSSTGPKKSLTPEELKAQQEAAKAELPYTFAGTYTHCYCLFNVPCFYVCTAESVFSFNCAETLFGLFFFLLIFSSFSP